MTLFWRPASKASKTSRSRGLSVAMRWAAAYCLPIPPDESAGLCERPPDSVEKGLVVKGLLEEIDGARLHRSYRARHVPMSCHDDDRQVDTQTIEPRLHFEPVHARHANVEQNTSGG